MSQNMYCITSVIEYIIMEMSKNIPIYTYSVRFAYNGISIITYLQTPALECIFFNNWPHGRWNSHDGETVTFKNSV